MEIGTSPRILTTKRRVTYRKSAFSIHEFEIWSGDLICRAAALRMDKSLLIWVGGRDVQLNDMAIGVPLEDGKGALCTALLGTEGGAAGLAQRLAAALGRQVHACCGLALDRFTAPLVERGIAAEIKEHPNCF